MKITYLLPVAALLGGCVSDGDMAQTNSQVNRLNSKISLLENELKAIKSELVAVKGQRVVRLPTGAPTEIEPRRNHSAPATETTALPLSDSNGVREVRETQATPPMTSAVPVTAPPSPVSDQTLYRQAMSAHQAGNSQQALSTLNELLTRYPNSTYRANALLGVGQINYQLRRFSQAEKPLETLVMGSPQNSTTAKAANLLKRVYVAQNKQAKLYDLEGYLQNAAPAAKASNGIISQ